MKNNEQMDGEEDEEFEDELLKFRREQRNLPGPNILTKNKVKRALKWRNEPNHSTKVQPSTKVLKTPS